MMVSNVVDNCQYKNLCKMCLIDLKKLCKIYDIKKLTNLNKKDIIIKVCEYFSSIRLQNFIRSKFSKERICPITMEPVIYPCFAYKVSKLFIYYNLQSLCDFLITSGDFRDPKTREVYSKSTILKIDKLVSQNKIVLLYNFKSLLYATKNKKFYNIRKDKEDTILAIERCLDDIIDSMRTLIEQKNKRNAIYTLHSLFFIAFKTYFRRLVFLSKDSAEATLDRTIISINRSIKNNVSLFDESNIIRDNIVTFLYQTKFEELGI